MEIFEKLGLSWMTVLFHALNLIILITALYFLLYKPVRKMVADHRAKLDSITEENRRLNAEAAEIKHEYEQKTVQMREELMKSAEESAKNAQVKADETLAAARAQAKTIVENARKEAVAENQRMKNEYQQKVSALAIEMAEKVLEREVSADDNRKIIDECLKEWE